MSNSVEFINKSKELFNLYDYSNVIYKNINTKVNVICALHGSFYQTPKMILKGYGCKVCSNLKKISKIEDIIPLINSIHGDIFDYSKSIYMNNHSKMEIECLIHNNIFCSSVDSLKRGRNGCKFCRSDKLKYSNDEFILKCREKHLYRYDYSKVEYSGSSSKIEIICTKHGSFIQTASEHLSGSGCRKCNVFDKQKNSIDYFKFRGNKIHNSKYDYSNVIYVNNKTKVEIICPYHGIFYQIPDSHINKSHGCPDCQNSNVSKMEIKWLDLINIPLEYRQKNIILNGVSFKVDAYDNNTNTVYEFYGDYWHGNPKRFPIIDEVNRSCKIKYSELYKKTIDREELIKSLGYNVISMWESDFLFYNR